MTAAASATPDAIEAAARECSPEATRQVVGLINDCIAYGVPDGVTLQRFGPDDMRDYGIEPEAVPPESVFYGVTMDLETGLAFRMVVSVHGDPESAKLRLPAALVERMLDCVFHTGFTVTSVAEDIADGYTRRTLLTALNARETSKDLLSGVAANREASRALIKGTEDPRNWAPIGPDAYLHAAFVVMRGDAP